MLLIDLLDEELPAKRGVILAMALSRASMLSNSSMRGPEMVATRICGFDLAF